MTIKIGLNGRFFPENWRPARAEIVFASQNGFEAVQWMGKPDGLDATHLGDDLSVVRDLLDETGISAVMEIVVRIDALGRDPSQRTPLDILHANLPAIQALGCSAVHWHLTPLTLPNSYQPGTFTPAEQDALEEMLLPQLEAGVHLGRDHTFHFGLEHNAPNVPLFNTAARMSQALSAVADLGFVWDVNHTLPEEQDAFVALLPRLSMLHISDTPLPATNYHWELGRGTIDFIDSGRAIQNSQFNGVAILEIGGAPWSGGFGQDTDDALQRSLAHLRPTLI